MAEDLYTLWLGVPAGQRPPDHYALLRLPRYCADERRITLAATEQLTRLDRFVAHPDPARLAAVRRMMKQVTAARRILLSREEKSAYDRRLAAANGEELPKERNAASPRAQAKAQPVATRDIAQANPNLAAAQARNVTPADTQDAERAAASEPAGEIREAATTADFARSLESAAVTIAMQETAGRAAKWPLVAGVSVAAIAATVLIWILANRPGNRPLASSGPTSSATRLATSAPTTATTAPDPRRMTFAAGLAARARLEQALSAAANEGIETGALRARLTALDAAAADRHPEEVLTDLTALSAELTAARLVAARQVLAAQLEMYSPADAQELGEVYQKAKVAAATAAAIAPTPPGREAIAAWSTSAEQALRAIETACTGLTDARPRLAASRARRAWESGLVAALAAPAVESPEPADLSTARELAAKGAKDFQAAVWDSAATAYESAAGALSQAIIARAAARMERARSSYEQALAAADLPPVEKRAAQLFARATALANRAQSAAQNTGNVELFNPRIAHEASGIYEQALTQLSAAIDLARRTHMIGDPAGPPIPATVHVGTLFFSPDSKYLSNRSNGPYAAAWETAEFRPIVPAPNSRYPQILDGFCISPDQKFACGRLEAEVIIYDAATAREIRRFKLPPADETTRTGITRENILVLTQNKAQIYGYDLTNGKKVFGPITMPGSPAELVLAPDHMLLISQGREDAARIHNPRTGKAEPGGIPYPGGVHPPILHRNPTAPHFAYGKDGITASVLDANTLKPLARLKVGTHARIEGYTPDGRYLVAASSDSLQLWDATLKQADRPLHKIPIERSPSGIAISPDGRHIAACIHTTKGDFIRFWEIATLIPAAQDIPVKGHVYLTYSPDGSRLLLREGQDPARAVQLLWARDQTDPPTPP